MPHIGSGNRRGCFCCQFQTRSPGCAEYASRSGAQDTTEDLSTQTPLIPSKPCGLVPAILSIGYFVFPEEILKLSVRSLGGKVKGSTGA